MKHPLKAASAPVSLCVNTYGTSHVGELTDAEIAARVEKIFDMRPYAIEQRLKLRCGPPITNLPVGLTWSMKSPSSIAAISAGRVSFIRGMRMSRTSRRIMSSMRQPRRRACRKRPSGSRRPGYDVRLCHQRNTALHTPDARSEPRPARPRLPQQGSWLYGVRHTQPNGQPSTGPCPSSAILSIAKRLPTAMWAALRARW